MSEQIIMNLISLVLGIMLFFSFILFEVSLEIPNKKLILSSKNLSDCFCSLKRSNKSCACAFLLLKTKQYILNFSKYASFIFLSINLIFSHPCFISAFEMFSSTRNCTAFLFPSNSSFSQRPEFSSL